MISPLVLALAAAPLLTSALPSPRFSAVENAELTGNLDPRGFLSDSISTFVCPKGYTFGSVTNKATLAAPLSQVKKLAEGLHFADGTWEGFETTASSGKDNQPGQIRSFSFGPQPLTEELVSYIDASPLFIDRLWKGVGSTKANTLPVDATATFNAKLASWTEHFTFEASCFGKATTIVWTASYCSTNDPVAKGLFGQAHTGPIAGFEQQIGTTFSTCKALN